MQTAIEKAQTLILSQQFSDGYWWYTLEANESIAAEYLLFHRYMNIPLEQWRVDGIIERILTAQQPNGAWPIYYGGPGSVGATTECYFALKLYGVSIHDPNMVNAREFILSQGGALKSWVFTRIHLAMLGILPWEAAPEMPAWFIFSPTSLPFNIYEFSSWARASIVPLLVIMSQKKTVHCGITLDELFPAPPTKADWKFTTDAGLFSLETCLIQLDKLFKKIPLAKAGRTAALKRCEDWIVAHLAVTEDIFPALMYGAVALHLLGHDPQSGILKKALDALKSFQMTAPLGHVPALPATPRTGTAVYQQCCISPTWDTAWAGIALLESAPPETALPSLLNAGRWLLKMQITRHYGDWAIKNKGAKPGGWAFEFQNDAFPDVDDTIEIMQFLEALPLPLSEKKAALDLAVDWVISMQCKNGGWAAFDKDNTQNWVNRIPFSDHKACLDPPTADITARVMETLTQFGYTLTMDTLQRALEFIKNEQTPEGAWPGRWGVHYLYGTWCVLQGLAHSGVSKTEPFMQQALTWLLSVQNSDGGWGESCASYDKGHFVPLAQSTASQTAWAVLALVSCGLADTPACQRAIAFLVNTQKPDGGWHETAYTGTGFPKHFYIRYHGYRHYFPLLALGKYRQALQASS